MSQLGGLGRFEPKEHRKRKDRATFVVGVLGGCIPIPSRLGGLAEDSKLPQWGSGRNLVHSRAVRKPLVAVIFSILKCIFYTRLIKI